MSYPIKFRNHTLEQIYSDHLRQKYGYTGHIGDIDDVTLPTLIRDIQKEVFNLNLTNTSIIKKREIPPDLLEKMCLLYNINGDKGYQSEILYDIVEAIETSILEFSEHLLSCMGISEKHKIGLVKQKRIDYKRLNDLLSTGNRLVNKWLKQKKIQGKIG